MKHYLKLVHFEIIRFRYILLALMALTAVLEIGSVIYYTNDALTIRAVDTSYIRNDYELISFSFILANGQFWFKLSMLISIIIIGVYIFVIWYRDWFGRSTFIYRLLMLPTARFHIYLAKATAILTFIFSLLSFQIILFWIQKLIFNSIVPSHIIKPSYFSEHFMTIRFFLTILPHQFEQFIISYGLGTIIMLTIFTAILLERSFRKIGLLYAASYIAICSVIILLPHVIAAFDDEIISLFYPNELFVIQLFCCVIVLLANVSIGHYLINRKITV
ncbi:MAG TPA: hypothetical protein IAA29_14080 [Candidatus Paenibacillus intestinavium]|nr:hypothetical protein [Candidatus Paenibacillus intestinavium]